MAAKRAESFEVRHPTDDEERAIFALRAQAFGVPVSRFEQRIRVPHQRTLVAYDGAAPVAALAAIGLGQFFGGVPVPMGGVTAVAIEPAYRGRGLARRLLVTSLEHMRQRGDVISTLYPATTALYRKLGWEIAGTNELGTVPLRALQALPRSEMPVRRGSLEDLHLLSACYTRVATNEPGWITRYEPWWRQRVLAELEQEHRYLYVAEADAGVEGYLLLNQQPGTPPRLEVRELVASSPRAYLALWGMLGREATVFREATFRMSPEEPLLLLLPEQDVVPQNALKWMTRVVDAPAAIAARGFPGKTGLRVTLELRDETARWNDGRWVLEVNGGKGTLVRGGDGRVRMGIQALSSLYTGWAPARTLARLGLMDGPAEDLAALDTAFAGPTPSMLDSY
ncbi:MAG TPA: GNAT family N-acetyltransferase [Myxococcaceae bacterium]|nr:GNAT family N-acetyltransferase [Myxococcaceae bacterium]